MKNWISNRLDKVLDYEQPTKYIVESTNYNDTFETPVLTAGKSFLLGYTDEKNGIFNNVPAIIFDDFTTAFHYVDFPFKVKSSAMKILKCDDSKDDLRFLYYQMGCLNIDTQLHKRYWISKFSKLQFLRPPLETQKRIAQILDDAAALRDKTAQLLKEYDLLAQSIFLEMFGDPRVNPKGWKVDDFKNLSKNLDSKRVPIKQSDRDKIRGEFPYYGATGIVDYINDYIYDGEYLLIAEDGKNLVNRKKPIGWVVKGQFWVNNHAHIVIENKKSNLKFLAFHLNHMEISNYVTGIDQFKLNRGNLDRMVFMTPPINLQNQFAEKIALIEQQKELAKQELKESEDLFNCLLQKAFKGELV